MRCFVALWPDPQSRAQLDALSQSLKLRYPAARRVRPEHLHLTLAFLGEIAEGPAARAAQALEQIPHEPADWVLDRVGGFARAGVLWAGGGAAPALDQLAQQVRAQLDAIAVAYDRKPFVAHVSMLRGVSARVAPESAAAIRWRIDRPVLVVSERGARGEIVYRRWERDPG